MYFDAHLHSFLSPDSEMEPEDVIRSLRKQGLGGCFTDHVDYVTPANGRDPNAPDAPVADYDFLLSHPELYPGCFYGYRSDDIYLGLEIGLNAAYFQLNAETAAKDGLDFVIGSVHFVDGLDITRSEFWASYDDPKRRYLEYMREMIELCGFFDSFGHIDYASRYSPLVKKEIPYRDYPDEYDGLLLALIERGKALELNSKTLNDHVMRDTLFTIFRRYGELGGKYITIGSDSHRLKEIGRNFPEALRITGETNLTPVYFKERKMYV